MLLTDLSVGNLGATGIVAAGLPIAVGAALSAKLSRQSKVAITFFGDGATNQGAFHEALNLAAVWKAPCVFFCENNQYAEMTPISKEVAIVSLAERACAYGLPGVTVDGNDVEEVFKVTLEAVQRAREGDGPTLIEAITYRLSGHMYGDPETYRSKDEVQKWRERDPLAIARNRLIERGTPIDLIAAVEKQVDAEIQEAVQRARSSPEPDPEEAELYVYARPA
jgi:pyruvate dehydrogenase E1 component alpha subunit